MALSEREQRVLDELERGLYATDANLANKLGNAGARTPAKLIAGLAVSLIGLSLIVFAVIIQVAFFGVAAFVVMLTGLVMASSNMNPAPKGSSKAAQARPKRNYFEERWEKRRNQ